VDHHLHLLGGAGKTATLNTCFRPQPDGRQFGLLSTDFIRNYSKEKFGKEPKDLKIAIIHEDGAYGIDVSKGKRGRRQEGRFRDRS
jgi:branched-chain amino acid transport system substrate-binding protein